MSEPILASNRIAVSFDQENSRYRMQMLRADKRKAKAHHLGFRFQDSFYLKNMVAHVFRSGSVIIASERCRDYFA